MVPPILPYDLLFLVIDSIDSSSADGRQSLSAFSLADLNLRTACQERLFREVEITYVGSTGSPHTGQGFDLCDGEYTTGWRFRDLLMESPHIGPYVKKLKILIFASVGPERRLAFSVSPEFSLYAIVPRLPNLKKFLASQDGPFGWYNVGDRMRDFLTTVASSVTELDLLPFSSIPISIFLGSHNLRALGISHLDKGETNSTQGSVAKTKLRELHVGLPLVNNARITTWFNTPRSPLDISELLSLKFSNTVALKANLNGLLALCSSTLRELSFHLDLYGTMVFSSFCRRALNEPTGDDTTSAVPLVDLGRSHELSHLTIRSSIRSGDERIAMPTRFDALQSVAAILNTLPFEKLRPRQVQFDLNLTVLYLGDFDNDLPSLPWFDILDVLEEDRFLSLFSEIRIYIRRIQHDVHPVHVNMSPEALTLIFDKNERMKKLRERGLLSYHAY